MKHNKSILLTLVHNNVIIFVWDSSFTNRKLIAENYCSTPKKYPRNIIRLFASQMIKMLKLESDMSSTRRTGMHAVIFCIYTVTCCWLDTWLGLILNLLIAHYS
jgi:hypothetical protein